MPVRALSALAAVLSYPDEEIRMALPEAAEVLATAPGLSASCREQLRALTEEIAATDALEAEARYVDLFDRGYATSLNLFEHLHGETRDRGQAMVALKQVYEQAGFYMETKELPDYLPVLLEYLSQRDAAEVRSTLKDCAHIVRAIGEALIKHKSRYAAALDAVLAIAHEPPLDRTRAAQRSVDGPRELDRDWVERPAFEPDADAVAHRPTLASRSK